MARVSVTIPSSIPRLPKRILGNYYKKLNFKQWKQVHHDFTSFTLLKLSFVILWFSFSTATSSCSLFKIFSCFSFSSSTVFLRRFRSSFKECLSFSTAFRIYNTKKRKILQLHRIYLGNSDGFKSSKAYTTSVTPRVQIQYKLCRWVEEVVTCMKTN